MICKKTDGEFLTEISFLRFLEPKNKVLVRMLLLSLSGHKSYTGMVK